MRLLRMLSLVGLGIALSVVAFAEGQSAGPNIVIIFTDDQGYADVGVFGAKGFATPHLDRLAREGTVFRNFHVAQPVCSASRAALLTGCYPNRIGIHGALSPGSRTGLGAAEVTLAELVKPSGYATAIVGKWHLGDAPEFLPTRHGFDEYFGLPYSNDMWPLHPSLVKLPPDAAARKQGYPDLPLIEGEKVFKSALTAADQDQLTTQYTERAVAFIEKNRARPFLLYLAHSMPHVPLGVSDRFRGSTEQGLYGDVIAEIDWSVGQVLDALRRCGMEENTWVIFTSDNGPWLSYGNHAGSAQPLREGKGTSWEGGTRVPCIMRWPGRIPAGAESSAMFMTIDLFPTIAGRLGAKLPMHPIDGRDVWPLIAGQPGAQNPHEAYWFYYQQNVLEAVTSGDGRWKLVLPHGYRTLAGKPGGRDGRPAPYQTGRVTEPELYDLVNDVSETTNVAAQHPEIMRQLEAGVEKARAELGDAAVQRKGTGPREPGRRATEAHAAGILRDILATRDALGGVASGAEPRLVAVWDFDGTILDGDCTEGLRRQGDPVYAGLAELAIEAGLSSIYRGEEAAARFERDYRQMEENIGPWLAYPYVVQMLRGAPVEEIQVLARNHFETVLRQHYFQSSLTLLKNLAEEGIESWILSASAEVFVREAAASLELDPASIHGIRVEVRDGCLTERLRYPVTWAEGKRERLEELLKDLAAHSSTRPVHVVAGFGNSYGTDGAFLEWIARQQLPAGRPVAVMINGGEEPPAYQGLFRRVEQRLVVGKTRG